MNKFRRRFNVSAVEKVVDAPENAWFRDLLRLWSPAGDQRGRFESRAEAKLRLAVRNGYLNFYRTGQSVARVSIAASGNLRATVHKKYAFGDVAEGRDYVLVSEGWVTKPDGSRVRYAGEFLLDWIRAAGDRKYAKQEKQFVDRLVSEDPGVIDLEAGLPWDSAIWAEKSAKRIDLVALERCDDRHKLVFWEAKLVTNQEARSRNVPKVMEQLERYQLWLTKYQSDVREAYQATCDILARLHAMAAARYPEVRELGGAVVAVARDGASRLDVDTVPRLIIDATKHNAAFIDHGHLDALRGRGIHVEMVCDADAARA